MILVAISSLVGQWTKNSNARYEIFKANVVFYCTLAIDCPKQNSQSPFLRFSLSITIYTVAAIFQRLKFLRIGKFLFMFNFQGYALIISIIMLTIILPHVSMAMQQPAGYYSSFLNQACASRRPACTWFLKIVSVQTIFILCTSTKIYHIWGYFCPTIFSQIVQKLSVRV